MRERKLEDDYEITKKDGNWKSLTSENAINRYIIDDLKKYSFNKYRWLLTNDRDHLAA